MLIRSQQWPDQTVWMCVCAQVSDMVSVVSIVFLVVWFCDAAL